MATDYNMLVHLPAATLVIAAGLYFKLSGIEWCWLVTAIALVLITETLNTALEKLVDLVQPDYHPLAGAVKDIAAAAVLLATLTAVVIGLIILFPYFKGLIG
jgi:diacylglycerol kinase